jgi:recombination protein RecA
VRDLDLSRHGEGRSRSFMTEDHRRHAIRVKLARMAIGASDSIATGLAFGPFPRGRIVELFGPPGCGKTSVALAVIAHWQRAGGAAEWLDADHTFDPSYASQLGVAVESLAVVQPKTAEQAFAMLGQLVRSGAVELLVVDSAAALVPALELETALGESGPGRQPRVLASGLRSLRRSWRGRAPRRCFSIKRERDLTRRKPAREVRR